LLGAAPAAAVPLDQVIPDLFGGSIATTISQDFSDVSRQQPRVVERFRNLSAALSTARSQVPIPSQSGAFSFAWDPDLDTFVRFEQSLGSTFAERAQTLGRGRFSIGMSYTHMDFDTLEGDSLDDIQATQAAFSDEYLAQLPVQDQVAYGPNVLATELQMKFSYDLFYLSAAYGVTDHIDVSLALAINRAHMSGNATAMTLSGGGSKVGLISPQQPGVIRDGPPPICSSPFRCAADSFNQTAVGTGDLFLRAKWHIANTRFADFAVAEVLTLPTGNADNFLGFHDPTFTPWFIASKTFFGHIAPHLNLGYSFRSAQDVSQAQWIAGSDGIVTDWLTLSADFLGYHDDKRDGINDDVIQSAIGFKVNPIGGLVLGASFQFPVNRDGLRADVVYTGQVEYTF